MTLPKMSHSKIQNENTLYSSPLWKETEEKRGGGGTEGGSLQTLTQAKSPWQKNVNSDGLPNIQFFF